eukprot:UN01168
MAKGSRNFLDKMFGRFDQEKSRSSKPTLDDVRPSSGRLFFNDNINNNNIRDGERRGFFDRDAPPFLQFPEGEKKNLPRSMYRSVSIMTRTGPDGKTVTTT